MKVIMEFNLPEDKNDFELALEANFNAAKIETLYDEVFRPHLKHDLKLFDGHKLTDIEYKIIQTIWEKVSNHFNGET